MIYLDANATTPVDPEVLEAMLPYLRDQFANPSAPYRAGRVAARALEEARGRVAALLGVRASEVVFTSGGTESNHAALQSAWEGWPEKRHLITTGTEHSAVIEPARLWESRGGVVTWLPVDRNGVVDLDALRAAVRVNQTALVSVMWANNETGVMAPMREIAEVAHAAGALVHTDASQVIGKVADLSQVVGEVDYLTLSGHKFHAPKGVGALYVSGRVRFVPSLVGGGQEDGRRSGTENLPGIVALGMAAERVREAASDVETGLAAMRDRFEFLLGDALPEMVVHGAAVTRLPNTSSVCLPGVDAAGMLILLDKAGVACSAGSACHSASVHPSHVLAAMGFDARHAGSTLRFSFSRMNTMEEVEAAAFIVIQAVSWMREQADAGGGPVAMG